MQIPPNAVNIAGAAALPQQTADARKGEQSGAAQPPSTNPAVERVGQGEQSGDRDANEQYSDQNRAPTVEGVQKNKESQTDSARDLLDLEAIDPVESSLDLEG